MSESVANPEGIERRHVHEAGGESWHAWPVGLIGLAVLLAASFFGVYGAEGRVASDDGGVRITVEGPTRIRSGEFYEMVVTIVSDEALDDLVVRVGDGIWRDVTVNTMIPAASEEGYGDGAFEFHFGPLEAGASFVMKVDCQVNPDHWLGVNQGRIEVADGEGQSMAAVSHHMEVLP